MRFVTSILALAAIAVQAQDLSTEIYVDRIVQPEEKIAMRPALLPQLLAEPQRHATLTPAEYLQQGAISNNILRLQPAMGADTLGALPYRGYASLGYLPVFNMAANAGYRFVDTQQAKVGAWMQYNGYKYDREIFSLRNNYLSLGAETSAWLCHNGLLQAMVGYDWAGIRQPQIYSLASSQPQSTIEQNANNCDVSAKWTHGLQSVSYDLSVGYENFSFGKGITASPQRQGLLSLGAGVGLTRGSEMGAKRWLGVDLSARMLSTKGGENQNIYGLRPYVSFSPGSIEAQVGVRANFGSYGGSSFFSVYPSLQLAWAPADKPVSAYISCDGEKMLNPVHVLFLLNPYMSPYFAYNPSSMVQVNAGINLTNVYGFSAKLHGGYAWVRNWLMPFYDIANLTDGSTFSPIDANTWRLGLKLGYAYNSVFEVGAGIEIAGSNKDYVSWAEWRDRAKSEATTYLKVHPMQELTLGLDWRYRANRAELCSIIGVPDPTCSLGDANLLNLDAAYRLTKAITLFARLENLLGCKYQLISGLPAQQLHGLVGVAAKF